MDPKAIAARLREPRHQLPPEDWERLRPQIAGVRDPDTNPDGTYQTFDPKKESITKNIRPPKVIPSDNWDIAKAEAGTLERRIVIVGAGASSLRQDLRLLDRYPSMGVNWTLKWFEPTYLHILDKQPFRKQIVENHNLRALTTQVITAKQTLEWALDLNGQKLPATLTYAVKDDSCGKYPSFQLAATGHEMFQSFANSLGYALQAAVCLGFRKIVLLGFDFAGLHFFGDGRTEGCFSHYGEVGIPKHYLRPMLLAQAHLYARHGIKVAQVGPTELKDCYKVFPTLEEALNGV